MFLQVLLAKGRAADQGPEAPIVGAGDEAAVGGVFPNGEPRAGRAPGVHDFGVRSRFGAEPFEEVEDQAFDDFGQGWLRFARGSALSAARFDFKTDPSPPAQWH